MSNFNNLNLKNLQIVKISLEEWFMERLSNNLFLSGMRLPQIIYQRSEDLNPVWQGRKTRMLPLCCTPPPRYIPGCCIFDQKVITPVFNLHRCELKVWFMRCPDMLKIKTIPLSCSVVDLFEMKKTYLLCHVCSFLWTIDPGGGERLRNWDLLTRLIQMLTQR